MRNPTSEGVPEVSYPVVTEEDFPDGLCCIRCKRPLESGQPYTMNFDGFTEDGMTMEEICCVYC